MNKLLPTNRVRLRMHHLICVLGFQGQGYSPKFVENFWLIVKKLNDHQNIEITQTIDEICEPCPNKKTESECLDEAKIQTLDGNWAKTLQLKTKTIYAWGHLKNVIREKANDAEFDKNCSACSWQKLGVCKEALRKLRVQGII